MKKWWRQLEREKEKEDGRSDLSLKQRDYVRELMSQTTYSTDFTPFHHRFFTHREHRRGHRGRVFGKSVLFVREQCKNLCEASLQDRRWCWSLHQKRHIFIRYVYWLMETCFVFSWRDYNEKPVPWWISALSFVVVQPPLHSIREIF